MCEFIDLQRVNKYLNAGQNLLWSIHSTEYNRKKKSCIIL